MSDTITLIAGILLTSAGLLALLPFVLRLGHRRRDAERLAIDDRFLPALAAAGVQLSESEQQAQDSTNETEETSADSVETESEVSQPMVELLQPRARSSAVDVGEDYLLPEAALASVHDDMEELMAHLFSLRMTVSEITAEVFELQDVLFGEEPDEDSNGDAVAGEEPLRTAETAA